MKNLTRVMEGTMDQYLRQKKKLGEKKFFRILRKKYGSEDIGWPENAPLLSYYDRG